MSTAAAVAPLCHERTVDGRERHYLTRVGRQWVCACGERRDRFGRPVELFLGVVCQAQEQEAGE